ncbi:endonuclease/exonuclease/phosphatase family protein [Streptomyces glaucosporus]|uniref:Endonuclease/exonuclease/phosphatase family protein n=1 Tax=Streptomyces glaucosporus TaxID=284044 RepID=A0ABN3IPA9_9ACTN
MSRSPARTAALTVAALTSTLLAVPAAAADDGAVRVHDIQGSTRVSPLDGERVSEVSGVVTAVRAYGSRGFWIQDTAPDADPATSEGLFVYTGSAPKVSVGDLVRVSGTVDEYRQGGESSGNQTVTQITRPQVTVVSSGNALPDPVVLDSRSVPAAYAPQGDPAAGGGIEGLELRPDAYALDLYESLEGMDVQVRDARVVGPSTEHAELWVTVRPGDNPTRRGGTVYGGYDEQNPGRVKVESLVPLAQQPFPTANTGDVLTGATTGPLDYDQYGGYLVAARELGTVADGGLERERTRAQRRGELAVATYNVENLHPGNDQEKFDRLARGVVENLASPDILALEEIQDDNGPLNDEVVSAGETVKRFTEAIVAAGGPRYDWRSVDPADDSDGGQPGGNIRNVFLFNPERVSFVDRPGADATTAVGVKRERGRAVLTHSPARVAPNDTAWEDSRKPLAGEFRFRGRTVVVIANHFASKGGDQSLHAAVQPPNRSSEVQRIRQATVVNRFVRQVLAVDRKADVVVLGDINDFEFSATARALTAGGALRSAVLSLPESERYTYVFDGNSQVLDQTLVSPGIRRFDYDIVHVNAEFADQASDHDPQVIRFRP